jgi:uncharacterized surface protein with fasciclin (FAS1) repeats
MIKKYIKTLSLMALCLMTSNVSAFAADIVDTAASAGSFEMFLAAVQAAGLTQMLKNQGPYTVFAPTDQAFAKIPPETLNAIMTDKTRLAQILKHHIIPGKLLVAEVKPGEVTTIEGDSIKLASDNGKITVANDANVVQSDIAADNGIIQAIDTVDLSN